MNASGTLCTWENELSGLGKSRSGAIVTKSCTFQPRAGNDRPKYFENDFGSINSNGLENVGYESYAKWAPQMKSFHKPYIVSVVGFDLEEFESMVSHLCRAGVDGIEANLSCPNIVGKPQVAYDVEASEKYLEAIRSACSAPLWVKLPPYLEELDRAEMAKLLLKHRVDGVTLINSIGNALIVDWEQEQTVIKPKGGLGGLGGKYVKPIALANVRSFFLELRDQIPIIGVGGIYSGTDAFEFFLCGASLVQVGSAFKSEGVSVFDRIEREFRQLMRQKNYSSIGQFRGKLKVVEQEAYGFGA